ncbi:hypothetical protein C2S53_008067 [Perilla frutescens var. hirtella]|uniref:Uncharacterized protein n=1 Tax=Perilla frutescens var. hirtella TaxID=608512 RepID=A0AAD4JE26_PERFH|nr:hypothetical protein C2S53_008067 [Perilla frutescens var. hirtella]
MIDFIAEYLGLPLVPPFYGGENLSGGRSVNFAAASANALPDSFFASKGIQVNNANISLVDQLRWFKELFLSNFYQKPSDRKKYLESSLILVGEIGGNDYNHALLGGKSMELVETFVPQVVKVIGSTIREIIKLGGLTLMVPGNIPIGCSTTYLTEYKNSKENDYYDPETGCINWLNKFSQYHNKQLQSEISRIQQENPNAKIIYADYYNAAMRFYRSPQKYGFAKGALTACCPRCGPYKVEPSSPSQWWPRRGHKLGPEACENPSEYVSWDGLHLTEAAYKLIVTNLVPKSFAIPQLNSNSVCASSLNALSNH